MNDIIKSLFLRTQYRSIYEYAHRWNDCDYMHVDYVLKSTKDLMLGLTGNRILVYVYISKHNWNYKYAQKI